MFNVCNKNSNLGILPSLFPATKLLTWLGVKISRREMVGRGLFRTRSNIQTTGRACKEHTPSFPKASMATSTVRCYKPTRQPAPPAGKVLTILRTSTAHGPAPSSEKVPMQDQHPGKGTATGRDKDGLPPPGTRSDHLPISTPGPRQGFLTHPPHPSGPRPRPLHALSGVPWGQRMQ